MTTFDKNQDSIANKVMIGFVVLAFGLLLSSVTQPIWRSKQMAAEYTENCIKIGGILLTTTSLFGTTYSCGEGK